MTIGDLIEQCKEVLRIAGHSDPMRDIRWIIAEVLGRDPGTVHLFPEVTVSEIEQATIEECIRARAAFQPVSQIIGWREFWGRRFRITSDTLDPRPETEHMVALSLEHGPARRVLDLGTGSGCILVTLLREWPNAVGVGVDISEPALEVADQNAKEHGVATRATFLHSHWWDKVEGKFDLILSNPPYITADEMRDLSRDVRDWEPKIALTPGGDGLQAYRSIAKRVAEFLSPGGRLIVEIGPSQADAVCAIFAGIPDADIAVSQDFSGKDRNIVVNLQYIGDE